MAWAAWTTNLIQSRFGGDPSGTNRTGFCLTICTIHIPGICIADVRNTRESIRRRANRIAGQVAGIQRMIEEDRYCLEILNQISAVRSALDSLGVNF